MFDLNHEQAARHVVAVAWSPAGLATHRRSFLTVLTSDHILSLWEPSADPRTGSTWKRAQIINHAMRPFLPGMEHAEEERSAQAENQRNALALHRLSVRAFAWSRRCPSRSTSSTWSILALANEHREILLLRIPPTPDLLVPYERPGQVEGVGRILVEQAAVESSNAAPTPRNLVDRPVGYADTLAWSPWQDDGLHQDAFLAYITNGTVVIHGVNVLPTSAHTREVQIAHFWEPASGKILARCTMPIKNVTGEVGLSFTPGPNDTTLLHLLSQQAAVFLFQRSSGREWRRVTESLFDLSSVEHPLHPAWQQTLADDLSQFDNEHDLNTTAAAKTWGLATSPTGTGSAVVFTMHPTDMCEYILASAERSQLAFSHHGLERASTAWEHTSLLSIDPSLMEPALAPATRPLLGAWSAEKWSSETVYFELLWAGRHVARAEPDYVAQRTSYKSELLVQWTPWARTSEGRESGSSRDESADHTREWLVQTLFDDAHSTKLHHERLRDLRWAASLDPLPSPTMTMMRTQAAMLDPRLLWRQIATVLSLSRASVGESVLSRKIIYAAACVGSLVFGRVEELLELCDSAFHWLEDTYHVSLDVEKRWVDEQREHREEPEWVYDVGAGVMRPLLETSPPDAAHFLDLCEICGGYIGWTGFSTGQCENRHRFGG
ncbi:MAG: hypothetical protein M1838_004854 [Thelocarpon superellum]|nr:MAG: hypothetical protein M1838_004854 [Thelocarpon superellum]